MDSLSFVIHILIDAIIVHTPVTDVEKKSWSSIEEDKKMNDNTHQNTDETKGIHIFLQK